MILLLALAALPLLLAGCATHARSSALLILKATGDPGVSVRVRSSASGVPEQTATVPAEFRFTGRHYDLRCEHGPQPGRLSLSAHSGGFSMATGDTTQPGQVTVFKVRPGEISARLVPTAD